MSEQTWRTPADGLPEPGKRVLIAWKMFAKEGQRVTEGSWSGANWNWQGIEISTVTAWQPMPAPYMPEAPKESK